MIIPNKFNGYARDGIRIYPSGGGGSQDSTVIQSNLPKELLPQVEMLLGGATKELFNMKQNAQGINEITGVKEFRPYSANPRDYVAKFSPLQKQVQANAANLQVPGQYNQASNMAANAGQGGADSANAAYGYGNMGMQSGMQGQQMGTQGGQYYGGIGAGYGAQAAQLADTALNYGQQGSQNAQNLGFDIAQQGQNLAAIQAAAGQDYASQMTNPYAVSAYMSPYQQNVIDVQNEAAQRNADIAAQARGSQFARAGAYGGARQAIENAEANRALQSTLNNNQLLGQQAAYDKAIQNMQYGSNLGLQGLSGAQSGLSGTTLGAGQLGLQGTSAGLQGVGQAGSMYGLGMQGSQMGLQGVDRQLAGTAQGMQGAQVGLQGVSGAQAGYGLQNTAAANLANIGTQQLAAQTGILSLQNQVGGQQQEREQQIMNQNIQNYANVQNNSMDKLNQYNALLRGYALPGTTTTQYQASPSVGAQIAGLGTAAIGAANLGKKAGGIIKSKRGRGLGALGMYNAAK